MLAKIAALQTSQSGGSDELILEIARDVQAVGVDDDDDDDDEQRARPWESLTAVEQVSEIYQLLAQFGVLSYHEASGVDGLAELNDILDAGVIHWMAVLLAPEYSMPIDDIVYSNIAVASQDLPWNADMDQVVIDGIARIVEVFSDAGVLAMDDGSDEVRLTPVGAHVVALDVPQVGYILHRADALTDAGADAFVDALAVADEAQRQTVADAWRPGSTDAERIATMVQLLITTTDSSGGDASAPDPTLAVRTLSALDLYDGADVAPALHRLLDGPAAGYAALYLMSRELADGADLRGHVDMGVFVDVLAESTEDPEALGTLFAHAPTAGDQLMTLHQMWRHDSPETELVLEALGRHLPDKKLAKAARTALQKHRSWLANQPG
jgi:hypothetical protein